MHRVPWIILEPSCLQTSRPTQGLKNKTKQKITKQKQSKTNKKRSNRNSAIRLAIIVAEIQPKTLATS